MTQLGARVLPPAAGVRRLPVKAAVRVPLLSTGSRGVQGGRWGAELPE